ncbi:oxidoreductase C-terminal domain-containing protein, partial [Brevundimonas sp. 357]|uniref:oxidoreductase C-terminal domain-containing protein n=1 Tax=Brevundimonas sp. 357 TaxID=2555782 RepID=UPI000FA6AC4A
IAGVPFDADRQLVRGDPAGGAFSVFFSVFHLSGDRIVAVEAVNAPADFMGGRLLIGKAAAVDDALLADPTVSIKAVAKPQV